MPNPSVWRKAWSLLDPREQRNAVLTLVVMVMGAFASIAMVGSVLPFLSVLADPSQITANPTYTYVYELGGFTSAYNFVAALGVLAIATIILSTIVLLFCTYIISRFATMRIHAFSTRLLARYLSRPWIFFLGRNSGDLGSNILSESQMIVEFFYRPAADLITASLNFIAITAFLLWFDPFITCVAVFLLAALYGAIFLLVQGFASRIGKDRAAANDERFRVANEALGGAKEIKLLGQEGTFVRRYAEPSQTLAKSMVWLEILSQVPRYLVQATAFGGMVLLCMVLLDPAQFADGDALKEILPLLGVFAFAGQRLMPELQRGYHGYLRTRFGAAAVERVYADLNTANEPDEGTAEVGTEPIHLTQSLAFEQVSFFYPDAERASLRDLSIEIRAGETVGIVGRTGAGKSTFLELALGLISPETGRVTVDGQAIDRTHARRWQRSIAYVPQSIYLADASIAQNIALGIEPKEIDHGAVKRAAEAAQLGEFIATTLPHGYESLVGERGVRLSGGQRQRIGLARALYRDADLIVLDEATSALDTTTEREVMRAIEGLPGSKTVLMVAHRLSTVRTCDRIIVLDQGKLVAVGSWDQLMAESPEFQSLAQTVDAA